FSSSDVACHVTLRLGVIHAMEGSYHPSIARSVSRVKRSQRPLGLKLVIQDRCDHRDPSMHRARDLAPRFGVEPVGKLSQPLVQFAPELNAGGNRWRRLDRPQTRHMLMADLAILPAGLNQAHCQPVGRLAKVDEHCSGTIRARLASEARPLLAAPGSSWRTARHSITSSARASSVGGTSSPSALAVVRLTTKSNLVGRSAKMSPGLAPRRILSHDY